MDGPGFLYGPTPKLVVASRKNMLLGVEMGMVTVFHALQMTRFGLVMVVQPPFKLVVPCKAHDQYEVDQLRMRFWLEITGEIIGAG